MKNILFVIIFVFIISCDTPVNERNLNLKTIKLDDSIVAKESSIDELINEYFFVKLETKEESLITTIDKIQVSNDTLFIGDFSQNAILIFNIKGEFINKISRLGRGPGEYLHIADFSLDPQSGNIVLLDAGTRKLRTYKKNGEFVSQKDINIKIAGEAFFIEDKGNYIYYRDNGFIQKVTLKNNISVVDNNQNYINSGAPIAEAHVNISIGVSGHIDSDSSNTYVWPAFNDTIYRIEKGHLIKPYAKLDIQKKWDVKKSEIGKGPFKDIVEFHRKVRRYGFIYSYNSFVLNENHILFEFFGDKHYLNIFDRRSNENKVIKYPVFSEKKLVLNLESGSYNNFFIVNLSIGNDNRIEDMESVLGEKISPDDNPVLFFFSLN